MMTALVDGLGPLPVALSTRIGAQTQRLLATVVIGGAISIALLTRVFQPTLVYLLHRQRVSQTKRGTVPRNPRCNASQYANRMSKAPSVGKRNSYVILVAHGPFTTRLTQWIDTFIIMAQVPVACLVWPEGRRSPSRQHS